MSWVNDLCKSIKSKCWCWCQCICCPNGDVTVEDDSQEPPSSMSSSVIKEKIKGFFIEHVRENPTNPFLQTLEPSDFQPENGHSQKASHDTLSTPL